MSANTRQPEAVSPNSVGHRLVNGLQLSIPLVNGIVLPHPLGPAKKHTKKKESTSEPGRRQHSIEATGNKLGLHTCLHVLAACSPDLCGPGYGCPK